MAVSHTEKLIHVYHLFFFEQKTAYEMVQHAEGDVEQRRLARAASLCDGGLEQVAIAVQLVVPGEIGVALLGAVAQLVDAVEVPVGLLRGGHESCHLLLPAAQHRILGPTDLVEIGRASCREST